MRGPDRRCPLLSAAFLAKRLPRWTRTLAREADPAQRPAGVTGKGPVRLVTWERDGEKEDEAGAHDIAWWSADASPDHLFFDGHLVVRREDTV